MEMDCYTLMTCSELILDGLNTKKHIRHSFLLVTNTHFCWIPELYSRATSHLQHSVWTKTKDKRPLMCPNATQQQDLPQVFFWSCNITWTNLLHLTELHWMHKTVQRGILATWDMTEEKCSERLWVMLFSSDMNWDMCAFTLGYVYIYYLCW